MFPNSREATTLAFHFWSGEFVYLCEDGPRSGLATNGLGIPSHPELVRREQQRAEGTNYIPTGRCQGMGIGTPAIFFVDAPNVGHKIDLFEPGPQANQSVHNTFKSRRSDVKSTHDHNSMIATRYQGCLTQRCSADYENCRLVFGILRACFESGFRHLVMICPSRAPN
jgi:hypothetical protein